jgi:hypothetical protein
MCRLEAKFAQADEIDVVERSFRIVRHKREKYRCRCGAAIETALGPDKLIAGGRYSIDFAVDVAIAKFADHRVPRRHAQPPRGRRSRSCCMEDEEGPSGSGCRPPTCDRRVVTKTASGDAGLTYLGEVSCDDSSPIRVISTQRVPFAEEKGNHFEPDGNDSVERPPGHFGKACAEGSPYISGTALPASPGIEGTGNFGKALGTGTGLFGKGSSAKGSPDISGTVRGPR